MRGLFGVIFGLAALTLPAITLYLVTVLFGAYVLTDGIVNLAAAVRTGKHGEHWWELVFEGVAGLAAGVFTFVWPALTLVVLIYIIAAWAVITGVFEVAAAFRLRRQITGEWLLGLIGLASITFGVLLFAAPVPGALVIAWWIGLYAFLFGLLMLFMAFRLRRWSGTLNAQSA